MAIVKGPLVYCIEQEDNGENLSALFVDTTQTLTEEWKEEILDGVTVIKAKGKRLREQDWEGDCLYAEKPIGFEATELTYVPYANWGNRVSGEMSVWVKMC